jgi:energy-coupling factor transport system substrate-specific component
MTHPSTSLSTRGIVTIAVLASLGGVLSTFVGYLGNLVNLALGVPFGAGQFMAGLHVFWLVLIRVIVPRNGVGTAGGLLKGLVELFTASTHGIVIVIVSLIQGAIIDIVAIPGGNPREADVPQRIVWWLGAGLSSASNVLIFQAFFFAGVEWVYIVVITILGFCSGVIFAGFFAWETLEFLNETGTIPNGFQSMKKKHNGRSRSILRNLPALIFILFLSIGSVYYVTFIAQPFADPNTCEVTGLVANPFSYTPADFNDQRVTIEAELQGAYTHLPPANYTGVLLRSIISHAMPMQNTTTVRVVARDGYTVLFDLADVISDTELLLTETADGLWLIAGNYDGSLWVQLVTRIEVF